LKLIDDKPYISKNGDNVCLWEAHERSQNAEDLLNFIDKQLFPLITKNEQNRDTLVFYDEKRNDVIIMTLFEGDYTDNNELKIKSKGLQEFVDSRTEFIIYSLFASKVD
jgi:hypothetical protein